MSSDQDSVEPSGLSDVEIDEFLESRVAKRRLFPRAILVGLASGAVATAFRMVLSGGEALRHGIMDSAGSTPLAAGAAAALLAGLGTLLALFLGRFDKDSAGSGIPHMKAVLEGHASMNWPRLLLVKFTSAASAISVGLGLGREGPTVQMGGAVGIAVSDLTGATGREKRALTAAGAGSGLAAAFNAPLAGVTFVLEELQRDFQPVVFGAALLSAAIATIVSRLATGQVPAFVVPPIETPSLFLLPIFIVIGALGGLIGIAFNRGLLYGSDMGAKLRKKGWVYVALVVGAAAGGAQLVSPLILGGGHSLTEAAVHGEILLIPAAAFFLVRLLFVKVSYSSGTAGGIFAPLLSLGALVGLIVHQSLSLMVPTMPQTAACVVAGMCALFSGVVRAPLTGIILIAEMTGSYDLLLPLLAASFTAYAVAEGLGDTPIYEALLQRDAGRKGWNLTDAELLTSEFEIKSGSRFEGKAVKDLGLPQGTLIVFCRSGGKEFVPRADTVLASHMKIVVVASPQHGFTAVIEGVSSPDDDLPATQ